MPARKKNLTVARGTRREVICGKKINNVEAITL